MSEKESASPIFNYKTEIETRFIDFDMFGHVNNSVYFTYIEVARTKYWKEIIAWDWKQTGIVIGHAQLDFIMPILLHDKIVVYVRTSRIGNTSFDLEYQIFKLVNGTEQLCSKGHTVCIAVDYQLKKPTTIPADALEKMKIFENLK